MADCELITTCAFFNDRMANMPATAQVYKNRFCKNGCDQCARHRIFATAGREHVPPDLFPNQMERVDRILERLR